MTSQQLKDQVLSFSEKPKVWVFCGPGGGHGDTLIQAATISIFGSVVIHPIHSMLGVEDSHVIVVGSGGFLDIYPRFGLMLARFSGSNDFTILPSTIDINQVKSLKGKTHQIFCRDQQSYDTLEADDFNVIFCEDTVIVSGMVQINPDRAGAIHLFRNDRESARRINTPSSFVYRNSTYEDWFSSVSSAAEIHTDLLHTAILGTLSGAEVHLYEGSTDKQKRVWAASLESLGVQFHAVDPTEAIDATNPQWHAAYEAALAVFHSLPKGKQALWEQTRVAVEKAILSGDMEGAVEILMTTPVIYENAEADRQLFLDLFAP